MSDVETVRARLLELGADLGDGRGMAIFGEGNISGKIDDERFLVKASGTRLGALRPEHLVEVYSAPLIEAVQGDRQMSDDDVERLLMDVRVDPQGLKPSVESLFHAWFLAQPGVNYVGHTHATAVGALLCSSSAEAFALRRMCPDQVVYCGPMSVLIPYVDPGLVLSQTIARHVRAFADRHGFFPKMVLMRNHGPIAVGRTHTDVMAAMGMAEKSARWFIDARVVGGPIFLGDDDVHRIASRTDEHYRQRMLAQA